MSAVDELLPIPDQPNISEGNKVFSQKTFSLWAWIRTKLGPALIETTNLMRNAVTGAFTATSTTSMAITVGEKTLGISPGRSFMPGTPARIARTSDPTKYLDGITKTYDVATGAFVFDGVTPNGTGTFTDWSISIIPSSGGGLASLFTNKFTGLQTFANESTVASASAIDLTAAGSNQVKITGAVDIDAVTMPQGAVIKARAAGAFKLVNSASLIVQGGADYVCEVKDKLSFIKDADGNVHVTIERINGKPIINDVENATTDSGLTSVSSVKSATPEWVKLVAKFTKEYVSPEQTITSAGLLTLAHGLGVTPKFIAITGVCKTTEAGYPVTSEEVELNIFYDANSRPTSIRKNSTNIIIRFNNNSSVFGVANATTGAQELITNAYWKIIVRAWA